MKKFNQFVSALAICVALVNPVVCFAERSNLSDSEEADVVNKMIGGVMSSMVSLGPLVEMTNKEIKLYDQSGLPVYFSMDHASVQHSQIGVGSLMFNKATIYLKSKNDFLFLTASKGTENGQCAIFIKPYFLVTDYGKLTLQPISERGVSPCKPDQIKEVTSSLVKRIAIKH